MLAGSAVFVLAAGVYFQFFHANPAASQTQGDAAGSVSMSGSQQSQVLAKVNNQAITYDVVARECVNRHGVEVLDNLINRLLIQQECERRNVTISQAEVEQEVAETAKKFNLPLDQWYAMLQSERGLNRDQYHEDIIWPMLALKKLAGKQVTITEEDMRKGFERDYGPRVKARMILVNGTLPQANKIWEECESNLDDFDRIARQYSADPNTRPLGGVIPPIRMNGGNKQVEDVAFRLRTGELSGVVQVAEGRYVILKCEGRTEPVVEDIKSVWNDLFAQLKEEKTQEAVAKVFDDIKDNARIDNFLTRTSTTGRSSAMNLDPTLGK